MRHLIVLSLVAALSCAAPGYAQVVNTTTFTGVGYTSWISSTGVPTTPYPTTPGPLSYNLFTIDNASSIQYPAPVGGVLPLVNGQLPTEARGVDVQMNDAGSSTVTAAISGHIFAVTPGATLDKIALLGNAFAGNGASTGGFLLGGDLVSQVGDGGSVAYLVSAQLETAIVGTGTALNRIGDEVTNDSSQEGTNFDAGIAIDNNTTSNSGTFWNGVSIGSPVDTPHGSQALNPLGNIINVWDSTTVAQAFNFARLTVTGWLINYKDFLVDGLGNLTANGFAVFGSTIGASGVPGEIAAAKVTGPASAPGMGFGKLAWVPGTNPGTCALVGYAGTSVVPTTIVDNVGGGC